jgi:hypothetical protein
MILKNQDSAEKFHNRQPTYIIMLYSTIHTTLNQIQSATVSLTPLSDCRDCPAKTQQNKMQCCRSIIIFFRIRLYNTGKKYFQWISIVSVFGCWVFFWKFEGPSSFILQKTGHQVEGIYCTYRYFINTGKMSPARKQMN